MYQKNLNSWIKHLDFLIIDLICVESALALAYILRFGNHLFYERAIYFEAAITLIFIDGFTALFWGSYKDILRRGYLKEAKATLHHTTCVMVCFLLYLYFAENTNMYSRYIFLLMYGIFPVFSYGLRCIRKYYLKHSLNSKSRQVKRNIFLIVSDENATEVIQCLQANNFGKFSLTGLILMENPMDLKQVENVPVVAGEGNALEYIKENWVDEVFINLPKTLILPQILLDGCVEMGITVHINLINTTNLNTNQIVEQFGGYTVLSNSINMVTEGQLLEKRLVDIAGGIVGLLITAVMVVIIGPVIYFRSPGPIFFSQVRIGKNGRQFRIYKFRSMYMDAEQRKKELLNHNHVKENMMFKMKKDPRIIKGIGTFIRKTSIDELPQFWNVLKGDMSLVGTRPPTLDEWEKYQLHHRKRIAIKPGITGLWQVSGRSNIDNFEEVVKLDVSYITQWSIALDFKILVKTIWVVLRGVGSE